MNATPMSENTPSPSEQQGQTKAGAKIVFAGAILILVAGAFVLANSRGSGTTAGSFAVRTDKADATYYDFEMPIFRVSGARPGERVSAELAHEGRAVAKTASGVTIDNQGYGLIRGDMVTDENSAAARGSWTLTVRSAGGETASVRYDIVPGCADASPASITTDKKEYRVGEQIRYRVKGPKNTQVRWFGLTGRPEEALNLKEANAYYGDVTNAQGEWESPGIVASLADADAQEIVSNSIVTLCDKTAQAKVTIRR